MSQPSQISLLLVITALWLFQISGFGSDPIFKDISAETGLNFVHFNGMSGQFYFPEMTGQGGALFDYDNDGDLDIYLVQGAILREDERMSDMLFPSREERPKDRLFRNDLSFSDQGKPVLKFVDVTDQAGLNVTSYGMGATAADFNNDGLMDLFITNYGKNLMFRQDRPGHFIDVTDLAGVGNPLWGTSAAAFDFDRDGWLDLYVANYVEFDIISNKKCFANSTRRDYCGPAAFVSQKDCLYHNRGDGTFEDVTDRMLADYEARSSLGVMVLDANDDGWLDLAIANDGQSNQLWLNEEGKRFRDDGLFAGIALNMDGKAEASMGICSGDIDGDGNEDLFMAHLMGETNTLYISDGTGLYQDRTLAFGLAAPSFPFTSFGASMIDYDNDGWLDLFLASGAVRIIEQYAALGDPYPLHQPNQVYRNVDGKKFEDVSTIAGKDVALSEVSRGAAMGDIDNDGDSDIVVFNNNGHVRLYQNQSGQDHEWIGLKLWDPKLNRDALGTVVRLYRTGAKPLVRRARTEGSYCSTNDVRLLLGLAKNTIVEKIEITWPDGSRETCSKPSVGAYSTLIKGAVK